MPGSPDPQIGPAAQPVLSPLTGAAIFLVVTVDPAGEIAVRDLLSDCAGLQRAVGFRIPDGGLTVVVGVGSAAWDRLFSGPRPAELHPFPQIVGEKHHAVTTPGDLLFHIRATEMDLCFEVAGQIMDRLRGSAAVVDEVHGFKYFDERDLLGFVDGTENPTGRAAFMSGDGRRCRSCFCRWELRPCAEIPPRPRRMERVAGGGAGAGGRAHQTGRYRDGRRSQAEQLTRGAQRDHRPGRHRAQDPAGQHAVRQPWSTANSARTTSRTRSTPQVTERMLTNMFIGDPPGNYDRILDFSTAITGSLFFVPSQDFLDAMPDPPADP